MKENKKKYLKIIALGVVIIAIITVIAVSALVIKNNKKEKAEPPKMSDNMAIDYFYNNYLISYLIEGDVKVGEGKLTIESTGEVYYAVDDEKLEGISSSEDITELIVNTLREDSANEALEKLNNKNYNNYLTTGDQLYVLKTDNICTENLPDVTKDKIIVQTRDDKQIGLSYDNFPGTVYLDETVNKWFMPFLTYGCDNL